MRNHIESTPFNRIKEPWDTELFLPLVVWTLFDPELFDHVRSSQSSAVWHSLFYPFVLMPSLVQRVLC